MEKNPKSGGALTSLKNRKWSSLGVVGFAAAAAVAGSCCRFRRPIRYDSRLNRSRCSASGSTSFTTIFKHLQLMDIFAFVVAGHCFSSRGFVFEDYLPSAGFQNTLFLQQHLIRRRSIPDNNTLINPTQARTTLNTQQLQKLPTFSVLLP